MASSPGSAWPAWLATGHAQGLVAASLRRHEWLLPLLGALLLGAVLILGLGASPLFDVDEGAFSEATREMLASHDWGHTTLNGADRFDKPIGVYWLQALSVQLFGLNAFALRLPSALSAWASALALAAFAAPRWGRRAAWIAAGMLATSTGMLLIGRAATADALLNLLLILAGLDLWRHIESGKLAPLRRACAWMALGLLVKGPVAVLVPGAAAVIWVLAGRQWALARRALSDGWSWALLIGIAAPWYLYAWQRHGARFIDGFLLRHNIERFAGALEGHGAGAWYYAVLLPLLLLPWSPLMLPVLRHWRDGWAAPDTRYLLVWFSFVLLFFSLSGTKLPHYALYGAPPLLLLMARQMASAEPAWMLRRALWAAWGLSLLMLVGLPWLLQWQSQRVADPLYRPLLEGAPPPWALSFAGLATLGLVLLAPLVSPRRLEFSAHFLLAALAQALLLGSVATPWWGEALQGPIQRAALAASARREQVVQWGVNWPSFAVQLRQITPRRQPQAGELALVRLDRMQASQANAQWQTVYAERGVALILWQGAP